MAPAVAIVIPVTIVVHHSRMVMMMTDRALASGFFGLSRRHVAVAPADFLAVVCSRRCRCMMVVEDDAVVIAVMVAMAQDAMVVAIMMSVAVSVMMANIITIMVIPLAVMVLGKSVTTQGKRESEK